MSKERWFWTCGKQDWYSNWADSEAPCRARSTKTYATEAEARKYLNRHLKKSGHNSRFSGWGPNVEYTGFVSKLDKYQRW